MTIPTTDGTQAALLQDRYSGQWLGFTLLRQEGRPILEVYDLAATLVRTLDGAEELLILDRLALVSQDGRSTVYRRSDGSVVWEFDTPATIRGQFITTHRLDDCRAIVDHEGTVTQLQQPVSSWYYDALEPCFYLVTADESTGLVGVLDAQGEPVVPCRYTDCLSVSNGYAQMTDQNKICLVELSTGEEVLRTDTYDSIQCYRDHLVARDGIGACLLAWDGRVLESSAGTIEPVGDDPDDPVGFLIQRGDDPYEKGDKDLIFEYVSDESRVTYEGTLEVLSNRTALLKQETGSFLVDLPTGAVLEEFDDDPTPGGAPIRVHGQYRYSGYFYLFGSDDQGEYYRLYREDGTLLQDNIRSWFHIAPGVLHVRQNGNEGLMCYDGTWIVQERISDPA